jgi:hypothetical protein
MNDISFNGRAYLNEYFLELNEEYAGLYEFWYSALTEVPDGPALEIGVGPTLYSTIPLAKNPRTIHLSDYAFESMREIDAWLSGTPGSFDWSPFIRMSLQTEGAVGTEAQIVERANVMKQSVKALLHCDMLSMNPLFGAEEALDSYAVVTAHFCTEAAAASIEEWRESLANICSLIKTGGMFLLSVCTGLTCFREYGDQPQRGGAPDIDQERLEHGLELAGLDPNTLNLSYLPAPPGYARPYKGTWLASGYKSLA